MDSHPRLPAVMKGLQGRDLLSLSQLEANEIEALIALAETMKAQRAAGGASPSLTGKSIAVLFYKPSTRTRISFEVAAFELGAHPLILHADQTQLGRGERLEDTARVMSRYVHAIVIRTYGQEIIERLAQYAAVPVINALTDEYHPVQILCDLFTLHERFGQLNNLTLAYVGDGNNVAHSLMIGGAKMGMDIRVACPPGCAPDSAVVQAASEEADISGGRLHVTEDPFEAAEGAHALYTDTWVSMGQDEAEKDAKIRLMQPYQLNDRLLAAALPEAVAMHCLPAHIGEEITESVFEAPGGIIFDQAENRLHMQKALLHALLFDGEHVSDR